MAIKLCQALDMSQEEFRQTHFRSVAKLKDAFSKNPKFIYSPKLPKPEVIYDKEFHFLDETLNQRAKRKAEKKKRRNEESINEQSPDEKIENNPDLEF